MKGTLQSGKKKKFSFWESIQKIRCVDVFHYQEPEFLFLLVAR